MTTACRGIMVGLPAVAFRVESGQIPPSPRAALFLLATSDSPAKMVESGLASERRKMSGREWYDDYLQSDHWLQLREVKIAAADRMCERCGEGAKRRPYGWIGLQVHHLTYDRIGCEELDDLVVLCIHCHQVEHGFSADTEQNRIKIRRRLAVRVLEFYEEDGVFV